MIFLSKPSVYGLPGTWEKQPMIQHLNLTPDQGFILFFGLVLFGLVGWGLYLTAVSYTHLTLPTTPYV